MILTYWSGPRVFEVIMSVGPDPALQHAYSYVGWLWTYRTRYGLN